MRPMRSVMAGFFVFLRFVGAAILAGALVFFGAGWIVHAYVGHQPAQTVGLTVIRGVQLISHIPGQAKASSTKATTTPQEQLRGFVQVGFTVGSDGRAHHIHVIAAEPSGQYEEAAREIVAARHYKPPSAKHPAQRTEVVHFQVPASVLTGKGSKGS